MRSETMARRTRAAYLAITALLLGITPLTLAITGAQAAGQTTPATLALRAPHRTPYGRVATIAGAATSSQAGRRVALQSAAPSGGGWHQLAVATIGRRGRFGFHLVVRRSLVLRAVEQPPAGPTGRGVATAASASLPVTSGPRPVTVSAHIDLARRQLAVLGTGLVRVAGRLLPQIGGRVVRLQGRTAAGWRTLARTRTGRHGGFALRAPARRRRQPLRVAFSGDQSNGAVSVVAGVAMLLRQTTVSWYDDAGATGCGFHAGYGVANKSLPCGTRLRFTSGGRSVTATVDDRGPYVGGREFDLNQNTAAALGFAGVGTVWVSQ